MMHLTPWMAVAVLPGLVCAAGLDPQPGATTAASSNQPAARDPSRAGGSSVASAAGAPNVGQEVTPLSPAEGSGRVGARDPADGQAGGAPPARTAAVDEPTLPPALSAGRMPAPLQRLTDIPWYRSGLVSLAVVLAVIAAVTLLIRRVVPSVRAMSGGAIEILGRNHLAPKQSLTLVRVGRRLVLVGVTPDRISTLCVIDDPHEVAELAGAAFAKGKPGFNRALDEAATDFGGPDAELGALAGTPTAHLAQAKGQLQGLMARLRSLQEQT